LEWVESTPNSPRCASETPCSGIGNGQRAPLPGSAKRFYSIASLPVLPNSWRALKANTGARTDLYDSRIVGVDRVNPELIPRPKR
jgi:hypothetical protein